MFKIALSTTEVARIDGTSLYLSLLTKILSRARTTRDDVCSIPLTPKGRAEYVACRMPHLAWLVLCSHCTLQKKKKKENIGPVVQRKLTHWLCFDTFTLGAVLIAIFGRPFFPCFFVFLLSPTYYCYVNHVVFLSRKRQVLFPFRCPSLDRVSTLNNSVVPRDGRTYLISLPVSITRGLVCAHTAPLTLRGGSKVVSVSTTTTENIQTIKKNCFYGQSPNRN